MGLIEGWRKIAQLNLSATSALDNNNARGFGMALASAAADLESACTPRPPKAEWFGAPVDADGKFTGKWDAWMLQHRDGSWFLVRGAWIERGMIFTPGGSDLIESIVACIPVRREGPPAMDVGWSVVGG